MGAFDINRNTATINMLITRKVKLISAEDKTQIAEVAGILVTDIREALTNGTIDSRVSYKIDIGNQYILNLSKLYCANKFLARTYEAYDWGSGEIFQEKPTFDMALTDNIAFRHKQLSSRMKITKVDEFMKPIFDDFIGIEDNGIVAAILSKVGADSLLRVLQDMWSSKFVSREELVAALVAAKDKLEQYAESIYRKKICPLVLYIGSTGLLPDEIEAIAPVSSAYTRKMSIILKNRRFR